MCKPTRVAAAISGGGEETVAITLVVQPPHKFFGAIEVNAYGSQVQMGEPEKAVLDCLDRPKYAGDIQEVAAMLWRGKGRLAWSRLVGYALRYRSQSLVQRLGYLVDVLEIPLGADERQRLLSRAGKATCYLGQPGPWQQGGNYDATWRVVDNVPRPELFMEIATPEVPTLDIHEIVGEKVRAAAQRSRVRDLFDMDASDRSTII
jgi:predicted transcriptional regulator of viral defense system